MRNLLARLLGENIELQMDLASANDVDDKARVVMDAVPMRQIILNLLLNARDAMPEGGKITLTVRPCEECAEKSDSGRQGCMVLTVADTGCGMDAATRSRIFQTFFTTKSAGQGTGLGLSTVGRIVKQHGGTIQVVSEPLQGTQVSVHLPRASRIAVHEFSHQETKSKKR
jgi:two-component system cell cycle sensor histidine kinase/response regulator CckA